MRKILIFIFFLLFANNVFAQNKDSIVESSWFLSLRNTMEKIREATKPEFCEGYKSRKNPECIKYYEWMSKVRQELEKHPKENWPAMSNSVIESYLNN